MTETLLGLVPAYGLWLLVTTIFFSCLAAPLPTSALLASAGAFAASGDLQLWQVFAAGITATLVGDQFMFQLGRTGSARFAALSTARSRPFARAEGLIAQWGGLGVFLSRTILSPVGPYVSFVAGGAQMRRVRFTLAAAMGALIWVGAYVGIGYLVSGQLEAAMDLIASGGAMIAAVLVAVVIGGLLWRRLKSLLADHAGG
ncbi:DedA family protein [Pseudoruegeria sp. SK021]|uniref:DedA family protein n=1 Tax=Pseudoruegeria sp. SK021 TaxID=1933035 RepID=UPI000A23AEE2|nr:VTT domain-containing protein [Pseudoruegeria sp. SK021]OSP56150.1 hypothetical protein BV911_04265 [Pseudoruegeria sp. SK021]